MVGKYEKPIVTDGVTPEAVEAGCCLRSCGGSPAPSKQTDETSLEQITAAIDEK